MREAQVQRLLLEAQRHIDELRLTIPEDNSALSSLREARRLDPDNSAIEAGFQTIIQRYRELARTRLERGELEDSLERIRRGLLIDPADATLLALRGEVREQLSRREQEQQAPEVEQQLQPQRPNPVFDSGWSDR